MLLRPLSGRMGARPVALAGLLLVLACAGDDGSTGPSETTITITTSALADGIEGVAYGPESLTATGGDGSWTWSLAPSSDPLPPGLSLAASGEISGTPTAAGTYDFIVRAASGPGSADKALSILVIPALAVTTTSLPSAIVGTPYGPDTLAATGGSGGYAWSLAAASGPLPDGLALSAAGVIDGTPTTEGTFDFTAQVTSGTQSADMALSIVAVPELVVTTSSLLAGMVGAAYGPDTLMATGGAGGYTWSLATTSDSLPDGLTLSEAGVISGTPTAAGTYDFTVRVTSGAQSDQAPLSIEIQPAPTATGILFATDRDGNWEIYWMDVDGSNPTNLTNNAATDLHPSPSPDGSRIAFNTTRSGGYARIWVMDADGANPAYLTAGPNYNDHEPSWSPEGSKIAFYATRDGNEEIYSMDTDGSNQTRLTFTSPASERAPAWSPDGSMLAFMTSRDGNDEIYVMDADGSNPVNLTNDSADDRAPAWSPDGSKIAFHSLRSPSGVYVMDADGSNPVFLASGWDAAWSPDGSKIAFVSSMDGNNEVYVMDADGSNVVRLTFSAGLEAHPVWTP